MNPILFLVSFLSCAAIAATAYLTHRHLGPFALVLARLRATRRAYVQVASILWVVAAGVAVLPFLAWAWPTETVAWAKYYFVIAPVIASSIASTRVQRAP